MTRRMLFGLLAVGAGAAALGAAVGLGGRERRLAIDPEAKTLVYRDGWIEPV